MSASSTKILQIVPRFTPCVDGVGDYALQLARGLLKHHQIRSDFLVVRPWSWTPSEVENFNIHSLTSHSVEGFLSQVPADISTVFLQYSNYPYLTGKLDTPNWLVPGLIQLKNRGIRIVVMFHELPTLRYRFIRCPNPIQRRVSRQLAKLADAVITNNSAFRQTLSGWTQLPVACIPNFSTIGEPAQVLPLSDRTRSLVVFGSSDRGRILKNNVATLRQICQRLNIKTLYDIGRPIEWDSTELASTMNVVRTGYLPAHEVSKLMLTAFAGIFDYHRFPRNLAKSTVYAAYCAHGLLPICNGRELPPQDGIFADYQYLPTASLLAAKSIDASVSLTALQAIAQSAHTQYRTHSLSQCVAVVASLVSPPPALGKTTLETSPRRKPTLSSKAAPSKRYE